MIYSIRFALQSLWHERWINLLSVLTIAMGLLVITLLVSSLYNIHLFTKKLPGKFFIIAYLKKSVSENESQGVVASVKNNSSVDEAKYISKSDALKELKTSLKDADYILEGLDENPLPASIEIRLKKEAVGPDSVKSIVADLKKIDGIDDVQYGEQFLLSIHSMKLGFETIGLIMTIVMTSGIIFICYSTVKILFYRKKEEVETLKLLGATRAFVRTPFIVEGGVIGLLGGTISMIVAAVSYFGVFYRLGATVPIMRSITVPPEVFLSLPFLGLFLGITGGFIATGRIRFN